MTVAKNKIILVSIIILAFFLRFWHLSSNPSWFIPEEVSTGWNAYSLLHTGRDEWGTLLPIIFRETGGFKLALNSYLIVPFMAVFGPNEFAVRSTTALAGVLAVFLTYLLSLRLFKRESVALSSAFLLAISPWHISMGRYGVDVNWGIPLFLAGLILFLAASEQKKLLVPSAILFGLTYFTYFNYVVFSFLFILGLLIIRRDWIKTPGKRIYLVIFLVIQFVFLSPYILQNALFIRFSQATNISRIGLINRVNEERGACLTVYPSLMCKIFYNKQLATFQEIGKNIINHFSVTTFFLYGSNLGKSGMPQGYGFLYIFEFPLLLLGIFVMIRKRIVPGIIILWLLLYGIPSGLAGEGHIWRMLTVLPLPQIVESFGLIGIFVYLKRNMTQIIVVPVVVFFLAKFLLDYFGYFPYYQGIYGYYGFKDLYKYLAQNDKQYSNVVIAPIGMGFNQLYIYYLFYNLPDPRSYQLGIDVDRRVGDQNWVWVDRIGKYYFVGEANKVIYPLDTSSLLVTDGSRDDEIIKDKTLKAVPIHIIKHANGDRAFIINRIVKKSPMELRLMEAK